MTDRPPERTVAVVVHDFDAPPEAVFDAWIDPELAARWWFTSPTSEQNDTRIDARLGGGYEIVDRRDGVTYRAVGVFTVFERPRRLAFTFAMPERFDGVDEVSVTIEPHGDGSRMRLEHVCGRVFREPYESGWGAMFRRLEGLMAAPGLVSQGARRAL